MVIDKNELKVLMQNYDLYASSKYVFSSSEDSQWRINFFRHDKNIAVNERIVEIWDR
jgi:hypothetical protein